jgi:hypothetical protein
MPKYFNNTVRWARRTLRQSDDLLKDLHRRLVVVDIGEEGCIWRHPWSSPFVDVVATEDPVSSIPDSLSCKESYAR